MALQMNVWLRWPLRGVMSTGLLLAAVSAQGQANTFTSGNPPIGDGNVYPDSLNPARALPGGGASADTFFANNGVGFTSLNGNPGFFDANNLLTRPAQLISGEAFWTDPRLGSAGTALIGFDVPEFTSSFGFDLAVASASADVPLVLDFQVQARDFNGETGGIGEAFGFGQLILNGSGGGLNESDISPVSSGTFATIGPRTAREARYRIDVQELESILFFDLETDPNDPDDDEGLIPPTLENGFFFDISLRSIATPGGTTQVAIDNFVIDNAPIPPGPQDPTFLTTEFPAGENRPQYLNYDDEDAPENPDGDTYEFDPTQFTSPLTEVRVEVDNGPPSELGAEAQTQGSTIIFNSNDPSAGLSAHEVTHREQSSAGPEDLPEDAASLGGEVEVNVINPVGDAITRGGESPSPQIVEITTQISGATDAASAAIRRAAENAKSQGQTVSELGQDITNFTNLVSDAIDSTANSESVDVGELLQSVATYRDSSSAAAFVEASITTPSPMNYANTTYSGYLAIKDSLGEELVIGDQGFFITPVFGDDGEIVTYRVSTWTVTNQSGVFTPIVTNIPEPTSLAVVLTGGLMLSMRRRR